VQLVVFVVYAEEIQYPLHQRYEDEKTYVNQHVVQEGLHQSFFPSPPAPQVRNRSIYYFLPKRRHVNGRKPWRGNPRLRSVPRGRGRDGGWFAPTVFGHVYRPANCTSVDSALRFASLQPAVLEIGKPLPWRVIFESKDVLDRHSRWRPACAWMDLWLGWWIRRWNWDGNRASFVCLGRQKRGCLTVAALYNIDFTGSTEPGGSSTEPRLPSRDRKGAVPASPETACPHKSLGSLCYSSRLP
jgi:hypothetical protein